ncbi:unnamed protein product [Caenorhabditis nigoni]
MNAHSITSIENINKGREVFNIATPENLEIYEKRINRSGWIAAGQIAMVPSRWIHFVWNPEDTIAVSGN